MGLKFPGTVSKKDKFLTTQDVGRMAKFANDLQTSSDPRAAPFKKKGIQLLEHKGAVYIVPAKPGSKSAARRHEKALLHFADHFGSQANQRTYGRYGKDGKNSNAIRAQEQLLAQRNKGSLTLDGLCGALTPVSNAQRCANARQVSEVVVEEARRLGHESRAAAPDLDVRVAGDWFASERQSEERKLTDEWIGLFQDLCKEPSTRPTKERRFLDKRFEETHRFVSCVWRTMGVEPHRDNDITLDTLGHQLLVAPEQRILELKSTIEYLHKMACANDQQEVNRQKQLILFSAELMRTVREAVRQRALVGNWLANELAPSLPGRMGQSAAAAGVNAVKLAARDMEPDSPFMSAYEWAAQNLRTALNERTARQTKAQYDAVLPQVLGLVSKDLTTGDLGPALPRVTADASGKAAAACDQALDRADVATQRVEAWIWLPAQAPNADLAEQLCNGLQDAWANFADDHGLSSDCVFRGLFNDLPDQLNRLSQKLDGLRTAYEATPTASLNEQIVLCSEETMRQASVYVGGVAAIGHFLVNAALDPRWPRQWRNDCMACGTALVQLAQTLVAPASHLMQIYNGARNAFLTGRKGSTRLPPERQYLGAANRRPAKAQKVEGDAQQRPTPLARRASMASLSRLEAEADALLQKPDASPALRRPRADSAPSGGGRALPRKPRPQVRAKRMDDLVESLKSVASPGDATEAEHASQTRQARGRVRPDLPPLDGKVDYGGLINMSDEEFDRFISEPETPPASADHGSQPTPGTPRPLEGRALADRRRRGASARPGASGAAPAFELPTAPLNSRRYRSPTPETSKAELDRYLLERDRPQDGAPVPRLGVDGVLQDPTTRKDVETRVSQSVPVGAAVVPPVAKSLEDREQALAADPFGEWDEVLRDLANAARTPSDLSDAERKLQAKWDKQDADLKFRLAAQDRAAGIKPKKKGLFGLW
ncbi:MAG: hypothetical protein GXD23_17680 [Comamonadaceae bacterium]|jgi:hypothetical protein|nr:hypothetical protein [Comamonadaceae bacterium]